MHLAISGRDRLSVSLRTSQGMILIIYRDPSPSSGRSQLRYPQTWGSSEGPPFLLSSQCALTCEKKILFTDSFICALTLILRAAVVTYRLPKAPLQFCHLRGPPCMYEPWGTPTFTLPYTVCSVLSD